MLRGEEWSDARMLYENGLTITETTSRLERDRKTIRRHLREEHPPTPGHRGAPVASWTLQAVCA